MRILINARCLSRPVTGVERYARQVAAFFEQAVSLTAPPRFSSGFGGHFWEQAILPLQVTPRDVLWSPANTGPLLVQRQALTIHDLAVLEHPEWFSRSFSAWYRLLLPRLARRVRQVIVPSQFTKTRLEALLGLSAQKIAVIPPGVDTARFFPASQSDVQSARARFGLPERYFLSVGTLEPRKNLQTLFDAWQQMPPSLEPLTLAVVGSGSPVFRGRGFAAAPAGVHLLGRVTEDDLRALYSGALAVALPSLYEGFGLPALEAMACGAPLVSSAAGGLVEAVGDAGLRVEPNMPEEWAGALQKVALDEPLRFSLRDAGLKRAAAFSWERSAQKIWSVLVGL